jgi:general secretion pathway protein M
MKPLPFAGLTLTREQSVAAGALFLVLLGCIVGVAYALHRRADALEELADRRAVMARLVRAPAGPGALGPAKVAQAPAAAFMDAPTQGQAGAQLQSYFARLALERDATVSSSGVEAPTTEAPEAIRVQATLEISLNALQELLYRLETGTPYVTVDSLTVQPSGAAAQQIPDDPPLRVTLTLKSQWRRGGA